MSIATNTSHSWDSKIERINAFTEPGLFEEWHNERTQAAVDVKTDVISFRESTKFGDGVLLPVSEKM